MRAVALPAGWAREPLCEVADIERDSIPPEAIQAGTIYVGLEHMTAEGSFSVAEPVSPGELRSSKFRFTREHVLYGKLRPYLRKIANPDFEGICSTDILPIRPKPGMDRSYLRYFLRQPEMVELATRRSSGVNLPRVSPTILADFPIVYPRDTREQKRIAAILDKADAIRRKRQQAIALTEALLRSTFFEMFGDPHHNSRKFEIRELRAVVRPDDKINYGIVQPGSHVEDGVPVVRVGDFGAMSIDTSAVKRVSAEVEKAYARSRLVGDEVLVGCVGSIGAVALADPSLAGMNIVRAVARIRCGDAINRVFLACYLMTPFVQAFFRRETRTVSQPTLNIRQIERAPIIVPPLEEQKRFAEFFEKTQGVSSRLWQSAVMSDSLFGALSQRAFRGEL